MDIRTVLGQGRTRSRLRAARVPGGEPAVAASSDRGVLPYLLGGALALGALVLLIMFLTDGRYRVAQVNISGTENLDAGKMVSELDIEGRSIFLIGGDDIEAGLKTAFPTLDDVSVSVRLPRQVSIEVVESDVVMVWESQGRHWWVGRSGKVYGETQEMGGLVTVHDREGVAPDPEGYLPLVPVELVRALSAAMPDQTEFDFAPDAGLVVYASDRHLPVMLGYEGDAQRKVDVLQGLLGRIDTSSQDVALIDLRNEDRPVYRLSE